MPFFSIIVDFSTQGTTSATLKARLASNVCSCFDTESLHRPLEFAFPGSSLQSQTVRASQVSSWSVLRSFHLIRYDDRFEAIAELWEACERQGSFAIQHANSCAAHGSLSCIVLGPHGTLPSGSLESPVHFCVPRRAAIFNHCGALIGLLLSSPKTNQIQVICLQYTLCNYGIIEKQRLQEEITKKK